MADAQEANARESEDGAATALEEVRAGLAAPRKVVPSKYFYDERGSELFERITRLPEYYLTRTERALLERCAPAWVGRLRPRSLVELGAGSAEKSRILLNAMRRADGPEGRTFVPIDVSEDFLERTAARVRAEYPEMNVLPRVGDMTAPFTLGDDLPRPSVFALLGSTIGNFARTEAVELLGRVRGEMGRSDAFLMGVDLRPGGGKSVARLEAAYNDGRGVTAEFNRNLLRVLNRRAGTTFDPSDFDHHAFYDEEHGRIEMHLVARRRHRVRLPGGEPIHFEKGETIRTEISGKYDRESVSDLLHAAGLDLREWREDDEGLYAVVLSGLPGTG